MSTHNPRTSFTHEEIIDHARANGTALALALIARAREHGEAPEKVARWLGGVFAPEWEQLRGQGARIAVENAALNTISLGASLQDLSGDERHGEATVADWPGEAMLSMFGLSQDEADVMFAVFEPIAEQLGLEYRWQRQGDSVTMTFEQGGA